MEMVALRHQSPSATEMLIQAYILVYVYAGSLLLCINRQGDYYYSAMFIPCDLWFLLDILFVWVSILFCGDSLFTFRSSVTATGRWFSVRGVRKLQMGLT